MATRTAVTGNWSSTAAANTAFGGVTTTAASDEVVIPNGVTVTLLATLTALCRSLTIQAGGTLVMQNNTIITIGDGTAGTGNVALSISSTATLTLVSVPTINFVSTSATQQTITTGGKTLPNVTFNGVGSWINSDAMTGAGNLTVSQGLYATGNFAVNVVALILGATSTVRTFSPGSSAISVSSTGAPISVATATNLTIAANTAIITLTGTDVNPSCGGVNWNGASFVANGGGACTVTSPGTWANFTRSGTAIKTCTLIFVTTGPTVTSAFTVNSNSTTNRVLVSSSVVGIGITITAGSFVATGVVDFMDITGAGAATWTVAGSGATALGDCGGNSGMTFTTPVATTWTGTTGVFTFSTSATSDWSGGRIPLPQDDVSIPTGSGQVTIDMPRACRSIDMTGSARNWARPSANFVLSIFGSLTFTGTSIATTGWAIQLSGRGSYTVAIGGATFNPSLTIQAPGGTYTHLDAVAVVGNITVNAGAWVANGYNQTCAQFLSTGTITRTVDITNSIVTTTAASSTTWNITATGLTLAATGSTIVFATATPNTRIFNGGGLTYGTFTWNVAKSPGGLTINGANYFDTLNIGPGRSVSIPNVTVTTVKNWNVAGQNNGYQYQPAVSGQYISTPDSSALSITGDIDLRVRVALDDWTPSAQTTLLGQRAGGNTQMSYQLYVDATTGKLGSLISAAGTGVTTVLSTVAPTIADGAVLWVRVTWRASDGRTQFFTASGSIANPIASDFSQLGTNVTNNVGSIFDSSAVVEIGSDGSGTARNAAGSFYRAQIRNGIDGTLAFDADFTTKTVGSNTFTEGSANAATVTINGALAQVGDGRVSVVSSTGASPAYLQLFGPVSTVDYLSLQDIYSSVPYKFYAGVNSVSVSGNSNIIFTAKVAQPYTNLEFRSGVSGGVQTQTATFPFGLSATAGNLLLLCLSTGGSAAGVITSAPSGWTPIDTSQGTSSAYTALYYKIAAGGETTATINWTNSSSSQIRMIEIAGWLGTPTLDVKSKNNSGASSVTTLSTGAGVTNTAAPAYAYAFFAANGTMSTSVSITNGFQEDMALSTAVTTIERAFGLPLTTTGSLTTTYTWTTSRVGSSQLVVFRDVVATSNGNFLAFF